MLANYRHQVVKNKVGKKQRNSFLTGVKIIGLDDVGVVNKITNLISGELKLNIAAMTIEAKEGFFGVILSCMLMTKKSLITWCNAFITCRELSR
ncbi:MAG: hypothetical protein IPH18_15925 [Chitinophagaceae bacterium]|nr:hypothetical protein [Chitinophagaceae bacterium]